MQEVAVPLGIKQYDQSTARASDYSTRSSAKLSHTENEYRRCNDLVSGQGEGMLIKRYQLNFERYKIMLHILFA